MEKLNKDELMEKWEKLKIEDKMEIINIISDYDNLFDDLIYYGNDEEFINTYFNTPDEAVRAAYYGDYNFMDKYVKIDGYGNLESANEWDIEKEIDGEKEEIIDTIIENNDIYNALQYFEVVA